MIYRTNAAVRIKASFLCRGNTTGNTVSGKRSSDLNRVIDYSV